MRSVTLLKVLLGLLVLGTMASQATPISYFNQVVASGTLGATSFTNALVTVRFDSDTANVTGGSGFFSDGVGTATLTIAGVGTAIFTGSIDVFVNQGAIAAGIADETIGGSISDTYNVALATYDLMTAIGPLSGDPFIRPDLTFGTDEGGFNMTGTSGSATFWATTTTIPEPGGFLFVASGIMALVLRRVKK
jgi:hypothetical protein